MKRLAVVEPIPNGYKDDARAVLQEAAEMGFDSVIVFGLKDGEIHVNSSANVSRLEMIGALAAAQSRVWEAD